MAIWTTWSTPSWAARRPLCNPCPLPFNQSEINNPKSEIVIPYPEEHLPYIRVGPHSLGWGLVGASQIARSAMIPAIQTQPAAPQNKSQSGSWVAGIYSQSHERGMTFARETNIPTAYPRLADLLGRAEIQCIYISSHPRRHSEQALAALEADKHVLLESPLALSMEAAQLLVRTAQERNLILAVNYRLRAEPALVRMQQFVAEGAVGDIYGATIHNINPLGLRQHTWRLKPRGGGVILDRTIHSLDLLRFLLQDEIDAVSAFGAEQAWGEGVFDDVTVNVRMARRGVLVQVRDSYIVPHARDRVELYGTSGTLLARGCFLPHTPGELFLVRHGQVQPIALFAVDPFWQVIQRFNTAVRGGGQPISTGADALVSLEAALITLAAASNGQTWVFPRA